MPEFTASENIRTSNDEAFKVAAMLGFQVEFPSATRQHATVGYAVSRTEMRHVSVAVQRGDRAAATREAIFRAVAALSSGKIADSQRAA